MIGRELAFYAECDKTDHQEADPPPRRSIQRWDAGEGVLQAGKRAVEGAPMLDASHVECLGALHGEHITGVVEVFGVAPAEFLDDNVFRRRKPGLAPDLRGENAAAARSSMVMGRQEVDLQSVPHRERGQGGQVACGRFPSLPAHR
jgi:hypothetical protein